MRILSRLMIVRTEREYAAAADDLVSPSTPLPIGLSLSIIEADDVEHLNELVFEGGASERVQVLSYVNKGETLIVIHAGNQVASRGLVRHSGQVSLEAIRHARKLATNEHFIHYCRTSRAYSGLGLYGHVLGSAAEFMQISKPGSTLTISCNDDNVASIKGIERTGFGLTRRILSIGFFGGRLGISLPTPPSRNAENQDS